VRAADFARFRSACFLLRAGRLLGVTDGLALLAAWVMFGLLVLALATVILRGKGESK
jgi:hypothetical protein